ncbi:hypothetical protein AXK56_04130 [Tsukamurella pulmonis]|uniref:PTS EIIB type-2 domain-containing protein n=1 Tax=Tsukamurella pulmonis TaxID=47312 RepID=A0A1H1DN46_9ACTN|nr:PTS sugar transporter subunit IIB [Tsukamurella pulmonis]KXO92274.1 hypothetical protein AXK56_04130 [Tsukamurella pulmonis]SDQ77699.1 PTS system unknown substrate IIB component, Gat family [Tsukamurella pulmonis]SUP21898.1 Galactitol-specific phosphotransferase enzyme IIB component [Tsukamurella pulmonis]
MSQTILVACGTGVATSTHVATALTARLKERGLAVQTKQCRVQDITANLAGVSLVVSTAAAPDSLPVPVLSGVPLLTGIGADDLVDSAESILREKS